MASHRYTVVTWSDAAAQCTAALLDVADRAGERLAAVGPTPRDAVQQLREYLRWRYRREPYQAAPDFNDAKLLTLAVDIRPEYQTQKRSVPCPETIRLHVPCVLGKRSADVLACAMPTLGMSFDYTEPGELKALVTQYAQQLLKGVTPQALSRYWPPRDLALQEVVVQGKVRERSYEFKPRFSALRSVAEPMLARGSRQAGGRAWERDPQVADVARRLGSERASLLLVGEPGVGKSTVLADAIRRLKPGPQHQPAGDGIAPAPIERRFWLTSAARLIAGMKYLGQWQQRCEAIIAELASVAGVLCVENLLELMRVGGMGPGDSLAAFFLPYLQRGELRFVGEATPSELDACRRLLPALADAMQVVRIEPLDRAQSIRVLDRVAASLQQRRPLRIEPGTSDALYRLFKRFTPYQPFPGKPVAFLRDLVARAAQAGAASIGGDDVVDRFARVTGLPEMFLRDELPLTREEVLAELQRHIVGQDPARATVADLVVTFKAALNDPQRPIGTLLFCGPTGVGKTELARTLARYLFGAASKEAGGKDRLIRLDMSEYAGPGAAQRLLGDPRSPDGQPGELIRKVRQQPFTVVLFDEIEKAHPEVFDVLLSVLDEGRLTDRFGRFTTFRSAILILTSNLGGASTTRFGFASASGGPTESPQGASSPPAADATPDVSAFFRPEFFNRIDAVVTFAPLGHGAILRITRLHLEQVAQREGLRAAGLRLTWTDRLVEHLAQTGFDARYGARPLQRAIESRVVTPLAQFLVDQPGLCDAEIRADLEDGRTVLHLG